ncbi:MAG: transposase [Deltaproteobacteria bacterium]|jgi:putative transposase|nr:transposase [Deltaproteobacteria bacterium]
MARMARIVIPDIPHHIVQRGNRRQHVFFSDEDKSFYLNTLADNARTNGLSIWAYCLMDNHVHLVVVPRNVAGLAKGIGDTHRSYSRRVNFREGWRGYLWQGRFSSCPMDEPHLYRAVRYVERNPVRAKMVIKAEDYIWSSAQAHVLARDDVCLSGDEREILEIDDWMAYLRDADDEIYLRAFRRSSRTGRALGDDNFIDKLEALTGRVLRKNKPGPKVGN